MTCQHEFEYEEYCFANVCWHCREHRRLGRTLARCYCGWSQSGGDGRAELIEMGENLEGL